MKRGESVKPIIAVEYYLLITPKYKERDKKVVTYFTLRTVPEFTYFRYEIIVKPVIQDRTIRFDIHGLRAPLVTIPNMGPATFTAEFENLSGDYTLIVSKHGKKVNRFLLKIKKNKIIVEKSPENKFIEIVTDETK